MEEPASGVTTADKLESIEKEVDTFNEYVNPGDSAIWDEHAAAVHGLKRTDDCIKNAAEIALTI